MSKEIKVNWNKPDLMLRLISRMNAILEEKYPDNLNEGNIAHVVLKLAETIGEDAWCAFNNCRTNFFPTLNYSDHTKIQDALRGHLNAVNIYYLDWYNQTEEAANPIREAKLISNINTIITRFSNNCQPNIDDIASHLVYTLSYDALRGLSESKFEYETSHTQTKNFKYINKEQRAAIAAKLKKYIEQYGVGFTNWNKFPTIDDYIYSSGKL
jgi:hypothetical protein